MGILCSSCDREILDNPLIYLEKEPDLSNKLNRYTINNIELDNFGEILHKYIKIYIKDYDIFFINCKFKLEFDNNFKLDIETNYIHSGEYKKNSDILSFVIKYHELIGYKLYCIKQIDILILTDRCNITYKNYIKTAPMVEKRININIAKNPQLLNLFDGNKNHPLIRKNNHIPFNN